MYNTAAYDHWLTTDIYAEQDWERILREDYFECLVRKEHPNLEDEAVMILAKEYMELEDERIYEYKYPF